MRSNTTCNSHFVMIVIINPWACNFRIDEIWITIETFCVLDKKEEYGEIHVWEPL